MADFLILCTVVFTAGYIAIAVDHWLQHTTAERERMDRFCEESTYPATVAHIAAQEAAGLDDEWQQIADGRWSM